LSGLLLFLSFGSRLGFNTNLALGLGVFMAICFVMFLLIEKKSTQPFIDLSLFNKPLFAAATVSAILQGAATIMVVSLVPFYLISGLGYSTFTTGLFVAIISLPSLFVAPISGRLSDRFGSRILATLGMSLIFTGLFCLTRLGSNPSTLQIVIFLGLVGTGLGIFQAPNNSSIIGSVSRNKLGTASAIATAATQLGVSAGFAIGGAVFDVRQLFHSVLLSAQGIVPSLVVRKSIINSFNDTLTIAIIFAGIGILTSLVRGSDHPNGIGR
jgi:predicted MFS family arabinose efflux permease